MDGPADLFMQDEYFISYVSIYSIENAGRFNLG